MTTKSKLPKPSAEDRARSARVRERLAGFAHQINVNARFVAPKKKRKGNRP